MCAPTGHPRLVPEQTPARAFAELRARFAATPDSVPEARRFVVTTLISWGRVTLLDDAALCVTELTANAALHSSSTYMEVALRAHEGGIRISVQDDCPTPAEAVAPYPNIVSSDAGFPHENHPTTGRGLAIVATLAREWGVEKLELGKRIWVELAEPTPRSRT